MLDRIVNWFSVEPAVSVLMIATAIVLFGSAFRSYQKTPGISGLAATSHRTTISALSSSVSVGIRAHLTTMFTRFTHQRSVSKSPAQARAIWGNRQPRGTDPHPSLGGK